MTETPSEEQAGTGVDNQVVEAPPPFEEREDGVTKKFKINKRITMGEMQGPILEALDAEVEMVATAKNFEDEINEQNPITLYVHSDEDFDESVVQDVLDKMEQTGPEGPKNPQDDEDTTEEPAAPAEPPSEVVVTPAEEDTELPTVLDKLEAGDTLTTKELSQVLKSIVRKGGPKE